MNKLLLIACLGLSLNVTAAELCPTISGSFQCDDFDNLNIQTVDVPGVEWKSYVIKDDNGHIVWSGVSNGLMTTVDDNKEVGYGTYVNGFCGAGENTLNVVHIETNATGPQETLNLSIELLSSGDIRLSGDSFENHGGGVTVIDGGRKASCTRVKK